MGGMAVIRGTWEQCMCVDNAVHSALNLSMRSLCDTAHDLTSRVCSGSSLEADGFGGLLFHTYKKKKKKGDTVRLKPT